MFYQYEIKNNVLYLYLSMKYEFSNEISIMNDEDLGRRCKNFIQNNNIDFKGNKVFLVVDGIVVKTLDISTINNIVKLDNKYSCDNFLINIKLDDDSICEVTLREYLMSLLFYQYEYTNDTEVLKAICILYNTYAYKVMRDNNYISVNDSFSPYHPINYYRKLFGNFNVVKDIINSIIDEVECIFVSYNDDYILPFIHYSNSGKTLTNSKYSYLSSVKSLWDMTSPYYVVVNDFKYSDINKILGTNLSNKSSINIYVKGSSKSIVLDNRIYSVEEFISMLNLNSNDIYFIVHDTYLRIITKGLGNSYGLSIYGACEISLDGGKYYNILKYYFPKTKLLKYIKELS